MKLTERNSLLLLLIAAVLILALPQVIRYFFYDGIMIGTRPYYEARMALAIAEQGIPSQDNMVFSPKPYIFNPYHVILSKLSFIDVELISKIMPFIAGILCIILFYLILKKLNMGIKERFYILLIFIISPIFVYLFVVSNSDAIALLLNLLAFYFFIQDKRMAFILSGLIFATIPFFGLFHALIALLITLPYLSLNKEKRRDFLIIATIIIVLSLVIYLPLLVNFGVPRSISLRQNLLQNFVSDFGSLTGLSIFGILLALAGLAITWKKNYHYSSFYLIVIMSFVLSFYADIFRFYINFLVAVSSGLCLVYISKMKWQFKLIRNLTVLILVCGLLFSSTSFIARLSAYPPTEEMIKSLEWLNGYDDSANTVLSHYKNGFWIEYYGKKAVLDKNFYFTPNLLLTYNETETIFYSRNLERTAKLLNKYDVTYIWITPEMKNGEVWSKENEGLLFLFRNKEFFDKIYDENSIEIWQYKRG
ncbi:MAG: hypothetical protein Q7J54_01055 [Candidatus Woesearchaeota archaeon]|nr:hypothetical protein [Candidatus Woesearchaeota archaeon]